MTETWYPSAQILRGPASKSGFPGRAGREDRGAVVHSAEGYRAGLESRILDQGVALSWHFSVMMDGAVLQHYPIEVMCWHARTPANYRYVGIECEGQAALAPAQLDALIKLLAWLSDADDWPLIARNVTLWEHNQFVATLCPSGRIPWEVILSRLNVHVTPPMTVEAQLRAMIAAAFVLSIGRPITDLSPADRAALKYVASTFEN